MLVTCYISLGTVLILAYYKFQNLSHFENVKQISDKDQDLVTRPTWLKKS